MTGASGAAAPVVERAPPPPRSPHVQTGCCVEASCSRPRQEDRRAPNHPTDRQPPKRHTRPSAAPGRSGQVPPLHNPHAGPRDHALRRRTGPRHRTLLGLKVDGEIRGLAELICFPAGGASPDAEAAFTVEPAWQGLGHGRALMEAALRDAARREVAQIVLHIQPQNLPMRRIAERHSFRIMLDSGEILATRQVIPDDQPLAA
ncbi:hypothetical protein CKO28_00520 [Rhodovibrio sodomensis]|uniref:N-acetyltransferase domain-containing protein n=1 Tax=Rhodovibrio sodomensis TaxID=1088 RepID=A0ABS1D8F6_9PROT|nr:hypothetical protein [Rhodovibrio sodomensis]